MPNSVGLEDTEFGPNSNDELNGVTERFEFVDGSRDGLEFFRRPFETPWQTDNPDDVQNADCVR